MRSLNPRQKKKLKNSRQKRNNSREGESRFFSVWTGFFMKIVNAAKAGFLIVLF
jgi:hypothetical protein